MGSTQETNKSILIVEDDFGIRDAMTQILEDEGYLVVGTANGMEALSYLRSTPTPPGLILLDLTLPIMSGWQFIAAYQDDPQLAPIPVVVMSADSSFLRTMASTSAAGYLQKPIEITTLLNVVEQYCG